jgi:hypothetical protein
MAEIDLSKKKIWGKGDIINFGKYRGTTIKELMKTHPDYLVWCQNNVSFFELDEDLLLQCEDEVERRRGHGRFRSLDRYGDSNDTDFDDDEEN